MANSESLRRAVLFDLDGVLLDTQEFEESVTHLIIKALGRKNGGTEGQARQLWLAALTESKDSPSWHDYSFHCRKLGIDNAWKDAHEQCSHLVRPMTSISELLSSIEKKADLWIVSDATYWVICFKLAAAGLSVDSFQEVFSQSRCQCTKRSSQYWGLVNTALIGNALAPIYIDNRKDLLLMAMKTLSPESLFIWVDSGDHPLSLGILPNEVTPNDRIRLVGCRDLALTLLTEL